MLAATVDKDGSVTIDMGTPRFNWNEIPLSQKFDDTRAIELPQCGDLGVGAASMVNVGNPHCIFFVENIEAHDLARFGPMLEHHPLFPERANISLAHVTGPDSCGSVPGSAAPGSPRLAAPRLALPPSPRCGGGSRAGM